MKNQKDISDCQEFNLEYRLKNYERKDYDLALSGKTSCYSSFYHKNSYENLVLSPMKNSGRTDKEILFTLQRKCCSITLYLSFWNVGELDSARKWQDPCNFESHDLLPFLSTTSVSVSFLLLH